MRIKQYSITFVLTTIVFLCFVFLPPAFAELKNVEEDELARTNASVSGTPVAVEETPDVEKLLENPETLSSPDSSADTGLALSPPNKTAEAIGLNLHVNGQETFKFNFGGGTTNTTGGITTVTPR